jgi:Domain of unknown function (DUF6766)
MTAPIATRDALGRAEVRQPAGSRTRESFWRCHALSLAALTAFLVFLVGMTLTGHRQFNADQVAHHEAQLSLWSYLGEGHFWEALFENWESEFLQMGAYVFLTAYLVQRGSAESKDPDQPEASDHDPRDGALTGSPPWPVRRGGVVLKLYENSLAVAFLALFVGSFIGHALGGVDEYNAELVPHGDAAVSTWGYVTSSQFWFESFQNWQSEFLAVLAIVVLTIFLRQRGSPESKPVDAPHFATGTGQ